MTVKVRTERERVKQLGERNVEMSVKHLGERKVKTVFPVTTLKTESKCGAYSTAKA